MRNVYRDPREIRLKPLAMDASPELLRQISENDDALRDVNRRLSEINTEIGKLAIDISAIDREIEMTQFDGVTSSSEISRKQRRLSGMKRELEELVREQEKLKREKQAFERIDDDLRRG